MNKVLYPGSFDPITKGHMSIIDTASSMFDEVVVAVLINPSKKTHFFTEEERVELIKELYKDNSKVKVITSTKSSVDVALENNCSAMIRGIRGVTDLDYEISLAQVNKDISDNKVNTICLFADSKYQFLSSSLVKEVFKLDKDIRKYVDDKVYDAMKKKVLK